MRRQRRQKGRGRPKGSLSSLIPALHRHHRRESTPVLPSTVPYTGGTGGGRSDRGSVHPTFPSGTGPRERPSLRKGRSRVPSRDSVRIREEVVLRKVLSKKEGRVSRPGPGGKKGTPRKGQDGRVTTRRTSGGPVESPGTKGGHIVSRTLRQCRRPSVPCVCRPPRRFGLRPSTRENERVMSG